MRSKTGRRLAADSVFLVDHDLVASGTGELFHFRRPRSPGETIDLVV